MKCLFASEMRQAEAAAIRLGIPALILMENAGRAIFEEISRRWPRQRVIVVAGKGGNGGDGLVAARHLWNAGYDVRVYLMARTSDVQNEARVNLDAAINMGIPISLLIEDSDLDKLKAELGGRKAGLIIDALFGIGLDREIGGLARQIIESINDNELPVIAADLPSGLNADTGFPLGSAVRARLTVSFAYPKVGMVLASGAQYVGEMIVRDISIPMSVEDQSWQVRLLQRRVLENLPQRPIEAHKGDFGRVTLFAGSLGLTGAASLAAQAAARAGAGLITLACPAGLNAILAAKLTEVMTRPLGDACATSFTPAMLAEAANLAAGADALVIGPGLGLQPGTAAFVSALLDELNCPTVIDADALNILAECPRCLDGRGILTPHPGEMAKLLDSSTKAIQADRLGAARECARRFNQVTVLKGFRTVIAAPDGRVAINPTGSSNMASGGMGDVLAGLLGALLAAGLEAFDAACTGAYLHGLCSDEISRELGRGQLASDLINHLPRIMKEYNGTDTYNQLS